MKTKPSKIKMGTGAAVASLAIGLILWSPGNACNAQTPPATTAPTTPASLPPGVGDIVKMTQAKLSEAVILAKIKQDGISYTLTTDQLIYLSNQGVSQNVITALLQAKPAAAVTPPPLTTTVAAPSNPEPPPVLEPPPLEPPSEHDQIVSIIGRAIDAEGGSDVLSRFKAMKSAWDYSGTDFKGRAFSMHTEEYLQSPDKVRVNETVSYSQTTYMIGPVVITPRKKVIQQSVCLAGSTGWAVDDSALGRYKKLTADGRADLESARYHWQLQRLVSLLDDSFKLSLLANVEDAPDNSTAIKVQTDGHPDAVLFFDNDSHFLVGIAETRMQQHGQLFHYVYYFSDFTDESGLQCPTTLQGKKDGMVFTNGKAASITPCEELPSDLFDPPTQ